MRVEMINSIQQVGLGVPNSEDTNIEHVFAWIRKTFGMNVTFFNDAKSKPAHMKEYTEGKVQQRHAILAANIQGGAGFELWQYFSRDAKLPDFKLQLGDFGIFIAKIKSRDVQTAYKTLKGIGTNILGEISKDPAGKPHFFVQDPFNNIYQVLGDTYWLTEGDWVTGGTFGCVIGVSDIEKSLGLYRDIIGHNRIVYDEVGVFPDFAVLPGGEEKVRRVLLVPEEIPEGPFSRLVGPGQIELVQVLSRKPRKIYENRCWGDPGFIHLCFDIHDMKHLEEVCKGRGFPFTANSSKYFDMGRSAGHFTYIEDPDGTLIEFVETYRIPIIAKLNCYYNLMKRDPKKPLPDWMFKLLALSRVRD
jgi:catechol 2,3-dioxygenase-like lactoylglutathione lyase family enzyme